MSTVLLCAATALARLAGSPWVRALLVGLPVIVGVLPALLLPENIIPYGTALISAVVSLVALVWVVVATARRR